MPPRSVSWKVTRTSNRSDLDLCLPRGGSNNLYDAKVRTAPSSKPELIMSLWRSSLVPFGFFIAHAIFIAPEK